VDDDLVVDQLTAHLPAEPREVLYVGTAPAALVSGLIGLGHHLTTTALGDIGERRYDVVCGHAGVLALPQLRPTVVALCDLVAPGGVVSLLVTTGRLEELAAYVAGRRMHVEAWYPVGPETNTRRDAALVHVVGRRDGVRPSA